MREREGERELIIYPDLPAMVLAYFFVPGFHLV